MKLFRNKEELLKEIKTIKNINFVPTMGSLHKGHESLIKKSVRGSKKTLVSIFINPKQFSKKQDYIKYPRRQVRDLNLLKKLKIDYVFLPHFNEIYGFKTIQKLLICLFSVCF